MEIPKKLQAGDTISWTDSLSEYSAAEGWTLKYRLVSSGSKIDITSAASGAAHAVTISKTESAEFPAGTYAWTAYVEKGEESYTLSNGSLEVLQDLRQADSFRNAKSHKQRTLEALEETIEKLASQSVVSVSMPDGRTVSYNDLGKLRQEHKQLVFEVSREKGQSTSIAYEFADS